MTTPNTEPNSLPPCYDDWQDWRTAYAVHVKEFKESPRTYSDEVLLKIRLRRLGFVGMNLEREIEFVKACCEVCPQCGSAETHCTNPWHALRNY